MDWKTARKEMARGCIIRREGNEIFRLKSKRIGYDYHVGKAKYKNVIYVSRNGGDWHETLFTPKEWIHCDDWVICEY